MVKIIFLCFFVAIMIGVGLYSRRQVKDSHDFFLGGRNMGGWISAFAYGTSYFSSVIFIGYAGKIGWGFGLSAVWIGVFNALLGCLLAWVLLAKKTRDMTHKLNASTMPEFFEKRYDSKLMKIISALVIFIFLVPYTASVYMGLGYLFESSFGISFELVILGMAVLTAIYLLLGGYVATAINDFIQGIIMFIGVIVMVVLVISSQEVGGLFEGINKLSSLKEITSDGSVKDVGKSLVSIFSGNPKDLFGLVFLTSFGALGLPQMIHKFYAIKDDSAIKKGTVISTVFALVIGGGAYFVGAFGRLFFLTEKNGHLVSVMPQNNPDMVVPLMLEKALPESLLAIIIVLVLSASMSTLSSLVLVSSSTISIDFIKGFAAPNIDKKKTMFVMRLFCLIFVAVSYILAIRPVATIVALMSLSWGVISGMFLAPYLFGLWWKGVTRIGAWAGFVSGALTMFIGLLLKNFDLKLVFVPGLASMSMIVSLISVFIISLVTKKYSEVHVDGIFNDKTGSKNVVSGL